MNGAFGEFDMAKSMDFCGKGPCCIAWFAKGDILPRSNLSNPRKPQLVVARAEWQVHGEDVRALGAHVPRTLQRPEALQRARLQGLHQDREQRARETNRQFHKEAMAARMQKGKREYQLTTYTEQP